jgi:cytochrome b
MKKERKKELSRRNFLAGTGAFFLTALLGGCNAKTLTSTITTTETNILTNTITNILTTTETTTTTAMITETVTEVINYEATVNGIDNVVTHSVFSKNVIFEELLEMYQDRSVMEVTS